MSHDDGKKTEDLSNSDVVLLGVSRTKHQSIYLANRGYKTTNIPLVPNHIYPRLKIRISNLALVFRWSRETFRHKSNRVALMQESRSTNYTDTNLKKEVEDLKIYLKI